MKTYYIKIRLFNGKKFKLGVVEQCLPDLDHPFYFDYREFLPDFFTAVRRAQNYIDAKTVFCGSCGEIVSIKEV